MRDLFADLVDHAHTQLQGSEVLLSNFAGETSDFVRFNRGLVRQAMTVRQAQLTLTLIEGRRHSRLTLSLAGTAASDRERVTRGIQAMRDMRDTLPEDPYLLYATQPATSERVASGNLPTPAQAVDDIVTAAHGTDLVGILASGPMHRGFANSLGSFHWHSVQAFLFDWSLYHRADKAVKSLWSGSVWDRQALARRIAAGQHDLARLSRPAVTLAPGAYRAYLAPAAVEDLLGMLNWDGISAKAQRTRQSCIQQLVDGQRRLSPLVSLREDTAGGLAPGFDEVGFAKPAQVALVEQGVHAGSLISARTAAEYGIAGNGAGEGEGGQSLSLAGGTLPAADALQALGTGLAIGNLHYLNFSDRINARVTGMTRFATFWVEQGEVIGPVNVMRWDDSLYRLLGSQLESLTAAPEWIASSSTYERRSVQTTRVPGALLASMNFTL